ncbi:hypothetical protein CXF68_13280 [Tenacibaculum sp. Bg11-29]|uniref:hypothetical protein n=1 Tax=Tenacibaculum sp. Bg11-29 TaxID=2058306 RepID=UPI000C32AB52|nr:hypothetical protein [Tenacibaculum sp. Bg11-29]PKH51595.1 hypothetical protein CXF68_13280 [Tenacibaculum sp. Bg11-29]
MKDVGRRYANTNGTDGARFGKGDKMRRITEVGTDANAVRGVEQRGVAEAKQGKAKGKNRLNLADAELGGKKPSKMPSLDELEFKDLGCK